MKDYDFSAIRKLVEVAFDDDALSVFCFDNFPEVKAQFTSGQNKAARVLLLVEY